MASKQLFLAEEGKISEADETAQADGVNAVLIVAASADEALQLARAYDAGEIAADNVAWHGTTIVAVRAHD